MMFRCYFQAWYMCAQSILPVLFSLKTFKEMLEKNLYTILIRDVTASLKLLIITVEEIIC